MLAWDRPITPGWGSGYDEGSVDGLREHDVRRLMHAPHPFGDSSHCEESARRRTRLT
jgi:hypothetical protein